MNESPSVSRLSLPRILLIIVVAIVTYLLVTLFPMSFIGDAIKVGKFDYWYYNGIAPLITAMLSTLTGGLTSRKHNAGIWIAGGAVLLVFGGMYLLFRDIDPTDRTIQSVEFMVAGVALGIFILYVWNSRSRNH